MIVFRWFTTKMLLGFMVDLSQLGLQTNEHHGGLPFMKPSVYLAVIRIKPG